MKHQTKYRLTESTVLVAMREAVQKMRKYEQALGN